MKNLLVCFSQTGNTRKVAEYIQAGMLDVGEGCDLLDLADVDVAALASYDLVGLGCPVFYYHEPIYIRDFIKTLPRLDGQQWFVFCTHGAVMGNTLNSLAELLRERGSVVIGSHDTYADATLPFYPYPTLTTGHPDEVDLAQARIFGQEIIQRSQQIAAGDRSLIPDFAAVPQEWVKHAQTLNRDYLAQMMPKLRINMDICMHCRQCVAACPVQGIEIDADPPRIQRPCIYCYYCAKTCPALAIEADWEPLVAMAPQMYARYREVLDAAAAQGRFRWLMNPNSLKCENPLYKQRKREQGNGVQEVMGKSGTKS